MCSPAALCASAAKYSRHSAPEMTSTTRVSWIGLPVSRVSSSARSSLRARRISAVRRKIRARSAPASAAQTGCAARAAIDRGVDFGGPGHGQLGELFAGCGIGRDERFVSHGEFCETTAGCGRGRERAQRMYHRRMRAAARGAAIRRHGLRPSPNPAGSCASRTSAGPTSRPPPVSRATCRDCSGTSPGHRAFRAGHLCIAQEPRHRRLSR